MTLPRLQLFEFEDFPWFPAIIRDLATDYLHFMETRFALHHAVVPVLRAALATAATTHAITLFACSRMPTLDVSTARPLCNHRTYEAEERVLGASQY